MDMTLNVVLGLLLVVFIGYQFILLRRRMREHKSVIVGVVESILVLAVVGGLIGGAMYLNNTLDEDRPAVVRKITMHFHPKKKMQAPATAAMAAQPAPATGK